VNLSLLLAALIVVEGGDWSLVKYDVNGVARGGLCLHEPFWRDSGVAVPWEVGAHDPATAKLATERWL
jgi:hypothetical protein